MAGTGVPSVGAPSRRRALVLGAGALGLLVAIGLDTTVVRIGSDADVRQQVFAPDAFGDAAFPRIRAFVTERAVDAVAIAPEVLADKVAAGQKYGTVSSTGAIMMVRVVGVMGAARAGNYDLAVQGIPDEIKVRVQTGPAINGTDLRDATGDIAFGSFKNQIEYQDAGSGINRAMKRAVLDGIDTAALTGRTVEVVGAFRLGNPRNWLITPVSVTVR